MTKLIYNPMSEVNGECIWLLLKDDLEFPFNRRFFDGEGYPYSVYTTDIVVCEYE